MGAEKLFLGKEVQKQSLKQGSETKIDNLKPKEGLSLFDTMLSDMITKDNGKNIKKDTNLKNKTGKQSSATKTQVPKKGLEVLNDLSSKANITKEKVKIDTFKAQQTDKTSKLPELETVDRKSSKGSLLDKLITQAKDIASKEDKAKKIEQSPKEKLSENKSNKNQIIGSIDDIEIIDTKKVEKSKDIAIDTKKVEKSKDISIDTKNIDNKTASISNSKQIQAGNQVKIQDDKQDNSLTKLFDNIQKIKNSNKDITDKSLVSNNNINLDYNELQIVSADKDIKIKNTNFELMSNQQDIKQKAKDESKQDIKQKAKDKNEQDIKQSIKQETKHIVNELDPKRVMEESKKYNQSSQVATTDEILNIQNLQENKDYSKDFTIAKEKRTELNVINSELVKEDKVFTLSSAEIQTENLSQYVNEDIVADTPSKPIKLIDRLIQESYKILKNNQNLDKSKDDKDIKDIIFDKKYQYIGDLEQIKNINQAHQILKKGKTKEDIKKAGDLLGLNIKEIAKVKEEDQKDFISTKIIDNKRIDLENSRDKTLTEKILFQQKLNKDQIHNNHKLQNITDNTNKTNYSITQSLLDSNKISQDIVSNILKSDQLPTTELSVNPNSLQYLTSKIVTAQQHHRSFLSDMAKQMYENYKPPVTAFKIALQPASLGHISILMRKVGSDMNISISTSRRNTLDALLDEKEYLKEALGGIDNDTNFILNFYTNTDMNNSQKDNQQDHHSNNETTQDDVEIKEEETVDFLRFLNPISIANRDKLQNIGSDMV